jgi:hypothetical protein
LPSRGEEKKGGASGGASPGGLKRGVSDVHTEWGPGRPWSKQGRKWGAQKWAPGATVPDGGENFIQNQISNGFESYSNSFKL